MLSEHFWFFAPDEPNHIRATCALVGVYLTSVGRATNLILNIAPDQTGAVPARDAAAYAALGAAIACLFSAPLGEFTGVALDATSGAAEVTWPAPVPSRGGEFNLSLVLQEDMAVTGQRIAEFSVEACVGSGGGIGGIGGGVGGSVEGGVGDGAGDLCASGQWVSMLPASLPTAAATAVGHKRILRVSLGGFAAGAAISALRFTALSFYAWAGDGADGPSPLVLARVAIYDWSGAAACVPQGCVLPGF